jgi:hypothetical protein
LVLDEDPRQHRLRTVQEENSSAAHAAGKGSGLLRACTSSSNTCKTSPRGAIDSPLSIAVQGPRAQNYSQPNYLGSHDSGGPDLHSNFIVVQHRALCTHLRRRDGCEVASSR